LQLTNRRRALITICAGLNDVRKNGSLSFKKIECAYRSMLACAFIGKNVTPSDSLYVRRAGAWNTLANVGGRANYIGGTGLYTNDVSASLEWDFYGENLVIGSITTNSISNYQDFKVIIDGVDFIFENNLLTDENYTPNARIFNNLGDGKHTVRIEPISANQWTVIDYLGTLSEPYAQGSVLIGHIPYLTNLLHLGYTTSIDEINAANNIIDSVALEFADYPVATVKTNDFYKMPLDVGSDGVHPNNNGHLHIFDAFHNSLSIWN